MGKLAFIGDVHAKFDQLRRLFDQNEDLQEAEAVIQLGDLGLWPRYEWVTPPRRIYFLDGNHEYFPELTDIKEPQEIRENLVYVPRGTVLELAGFRVGFLGGAESPDKHLRVEGRSWFREESISYSDMLRLEGSVDVLATHTPPAHVVFSIIGHTPDPSSRAVEAVWDGLGRPPCFSGHMHCTRRIGMCWVLNELEVLATSKEELC